MHVWASVGFCLQWCAFTGLDTLIRLQAVGKWCWYSVGSHLGSYLRKVWRKTNQFCFNKLLLEKIPDWMKHHTALRRPGTFSQRQKKINKYIIFFIKYKGSYIFACIKTNVYYMRNVWYYAKIYYFLLLLY